MNYYGVNALSRASLISTLEMVQEILLAAVVSMPLVGLLSFLLDFRETRRVET